MSARLLLYPPPPQHNSATQKGATGHYATGPPNPCLNKQKYPTQGGNPKKTLAKANTIKITIVCDG